MRRWLLLGAIYLALALAFAAPLLRHLGSAFPHDIGDPLLNTWLLWWDTQKVPFTAAWWNAPMFYPAPDVMALSEVLLGLLPITWPVQWVSGNPLLAYNVAFLLSFPLCGLATAALAFELTKRRDAAALAGLAFMFAPYRLGQVSHLQMLAYYGAPIALAGLHLYDRTGRRRWLVVFGAAWLLQALTNGYALFHLSILVVLWMLWFVRSRRAFTQIAVAWALAFVPVLPLLLKYQTVHERWHLSRNINEVKEFGIDLGDFLSAPSELLIWGERLGTARPETAAFPGATVLVIAVAWWFTEWRQRRGGAALTPTLDQRVLVYISMAAALVAVSALSFGPWRLGPLSVTDFHKPFSVAVYARVLSWLRGRQIREAWSLRSPAMFYVVGLVVMYLLALGPEPRVLGRPLLYEPPYAWLMRAPGFATLRVPARFAMLAVLCQSMLVAFVVARWSLGKRRRLVVAGIAAGLLIDGWARLPIASAPPIGPGVDSSVAAVVELPIGAPEVDFSALYHQMSHGRPLLNGYSGYNPPHYLPLVDAVPGDRADVLAEIDPAGSIEVAIDRWRGDSPAIAGFVETIQGARALPAEERWLRYVVPQHRSALPAAGPTLPITSIVTSGGGEDAGRMRDGDIATAWHSGPTQLGNEEVVIDLGTPQAVAAVVLEMGPLSFGYPRDLAIDAEDDTGALVRVFRGPTAAFTVRAALNRAETVPVTIPVEPVRTRRLHLRQLGTSPGIPWWIAELRVLGQ